MKTWINYVAWGWVYIMLFGACAKSESPLPPRETSPQVEEVAQSYTQILTDASEGWILAYRPDQLDEPLYFHLVFRDSATVDIRAGYRGYHTLHAGVEYRFEGKYVPILAFADESVFAELADKFNGASTFKVYLDEESQTFEWARADGYDATRSLLRKADDASLARLQNQIDIVLAQIAAEEEHERLSAETRLKLEAFARLESSFYFYNIITDRFSAEIRSFDAEARSITMTYKETPASPPTTVNVHYRIFPEGIVLQPSISVGSVRVDTIALGELDGHTLEITRAGDAGSGRMGYMHVPAFAYTSTANRNLTLVDWLLEPAQQNSAGSGTGLFMYTAHADTHYSDSLNFYRSIFGDYIDSSIDHAVASTRLVHQIYFPENPATSRNIQISTHRDTGGNLFFLYGINWEKNPVAPGGLKVSLATPSSSVVPHRDAFETYLKQQFPEDGVTVVPVIVGTTLRLRLVSRQDSQFWAEYILNRVADRSMRFD